MKLLNRFYDVTSGRILVDGIDVREWDLTALRRAIGLVQQDVFLFAGDIMENVRLGRADLSEEGVRQALARAQALRFVDRIAGGPRAADQRARRESLIGTAPAFVIRARSRLRPENSRDGRGHLERRQRDRAAHPNRAQRIARGQNGAGHRPSPLDHRARGPNHGAGQTASCARAAHMTSCSNCADSTTGSSSCSTRRLQEPAARLWTEACGAVCAVLLRRAAVLALPAATSDISRVAPMKKRACCGIANRFHT